MKTRHGLLHIRHATAEVSTLEACRHSDVSLKILAPNFSLTGHFFARRESTEGCSMSHAAVQQRVTHGLHRCTVRWRVSDSNIVGAIITHNRSGRWNAL